MSSAVPVRVSSRRGGGSRRRRGAVVVVVVAMCVVGLVAGDVLAQVVRPAAVTGVSAASGECRGELVVSWDPHPDAPSSPYRVAIAAVDGGYVGGEFGGKLGDAITNTFESGTETVIAGLVPGGEYKVMVRARFGKGIPSSEWSAEVVGFAADDTAPTCGATPDETPSAPSQPTTAELAPSNLVAAAAPGHVVLSWDAPVLYTELVGGYRLYRGSDGAEVSVLVDDTATADTVYVDLTADEDGVEYEYRVQALYGSGDAPTLRSAPAYATGQPNTITEPDTAESLDADDDLPLRLASLELSGIDIGAFDAAVHSYQADVAHAVASTAVTADPADPDAGVTVLPADADADAANGHQVALAVGANTVTVTVESPDGTRRQTYTVTVDRARGAAFARDPQRDLDADDTVRRRGGWSNYLGGRSDYSEYGLWSDGDIMWINVGRDAKVYAYELASGDRLADRDIDTLESGARLDHWWAGVWSNEETMWVLNSYDAKVAAFDLVGGDRLAGGGFGLLDYPDMRWPLDLWSDGDTVWVSDDRISTIYAFDLASGDRRPDRDIDARLAWSIWSDGDTMWALDIHRVKISAYDMHTGERQANLDFDTLAGAGNTHPKSIWSDGDTMWVLDDKDRKLYAYNMPGVPFRLASLELSGIEIDFAPEQSSYAAAVPEAVSVTTVSAAAADDSAGASVEILPADTDPFTEGHQVDLAGRVTTITVTIAGDGRPYTAYTVHAVRAEPDDIAGDSTTAAVLDLGDRTGNVNRSASARSFIHDDGDRDWFKVEMVRDRRYYIDMKQTGWDDSLADPMIHGVYDADGVLVAGSANDDGGDTRWVDLSWDLQLEWDYDGVFPSWTEIYESGPYDFGRRDAFVKFVPERSGTYYVSAGRGASDPSLYHNGVYDLEILERLPEVGDTPATSQQITVGDSVESEIDIDPWEVFYDSGGADGELWTGDHDWWRVSLEANRIYVLEMMGADTGHGTLEDPGLNVGPRDGQRFPIDTVHTVRNADGTRNDRQVFSPTSDGDYYILAFGRSYDASAFPDELGTYTLSVTGLAELPDVAADTSTTASVVVGGGAYHGRIDRHYDRDWIAVQLQGGQYYTVAMGPDHANKAALGHWENRDIAGVYDAHGNLVPGSGEPVSTNNIVDYPDAIVVAPAADGTYYIDARGWDFHVGDYTITVEVSPVRPDGTVADDQAARSKAVSYFWAYDGSRVIDLDTVTKGHADSDPGAYPHGQVPTWISVKLIANRTYVVNVESLGGVASRHQLDTGIRGVFDAYIRGVFYQDGDPEYFDVGVVHGTAAKGQLEFTATRTGTYHIAVERRPAGFFSIIVDSPIEDDASLSSLSVAGYDLVPGFSSGVHDYAVTVADDVAVATIEAAATLAGTVIVPAVADIDPAAGWQVDLGAAGTETVTVVVLTSLAPDGVTQLNYSVTITRPAPDAAADTTTVSDLEVGVGLLSRIDSAGERDWHRVELQAGVVYQIDMEGQWTGSLSPTGVWESDYTLVDPMLSGVYDESGTLVPGTGDLTVSGNGGYGQNSRFTFTPTVDGTYYIEATATAAWLGTYLLTVTATTQP